MPKDIFIVTERSKKSLLFIQNSIHFNKLMVQTPLLQLNCVYHMSSPKKEHNHLSILKGQKYKFEGYPEWYEQELAKNQPIHISKFNDDLESAVYFYKSEVSKLDFANKVINAQLAAAIEEKDQLFEWIKQLEETQKQSYQEKKKRIRRCASQIQRKFICQVQNCDKSYGTEGSMAQHMRLKHPQIQYNGICSQVKLSKNEANLIKVKEFSDKIKQM